MESTPEQIAKVRELFAKGKPLAIKAANGEVIAYGCYTCDKPATGWFRQQVDVPYSVFDPPSMWTRTKPVGDPIPACDEHNR